MSIKLFRAYPAKRGKANQYAHSILYAIFLAVFFIVYSVSFQGRAFSEEVIDNEWGYSLNLPAGYKIAEQDGEGLSVLFTHDKIPVQVVSKVYKKGSISPLNGAEDALRNAMRRLPNCNFDISTVPYRRDTAAVSCFNMTLEKDMEGWACAAPLPLSGGEVVVIAYTPSKGKVQGDGGSNKEGGGSDRVDSKKDIEEGESTWLSVIVSVLNSLATDTGSLHEAGIMSRFAYPDTGVKNVTLEIDGVSINTSIDKSDEAAADFAVSTEYAVLSLYANDPLYQEAWKRYYRAIFRDSYGRLKNASSDINNALRDKARLSPSEGYYKASALLKWVQDMPYARGGNAADFISLPAAIAGEGCDCDTRSLLLCTLLENMDIKCAIFVSPVYSHALFGIAIPSRDKSENARLKCDGEEYLLGETTAHGIPLGMVAAEHKNAQRWMGISLSD